MDDDGFGNGPLPINVTLTIDDDTARVDFTGTCAQAAGSVNANYAITLSATMYCFRVIVPFSLLQIGARSNRSKSLPPKVP